jgi:hypothetical protein
MTKIKTAAGNNRKFNVTNVEKIVQGIIDYYQGCTNQHLTDLGGLMLLR